MEILRLHFHFSVITSAACRYVDALGTMGPAEEERERLQILVEEYRRELTAAPKTPEPTR